MTLDPTMPGLPPASGLRRRGGGLGAAAAAAFLAVWLGFAAWVMAAPLGQGVSGQAGAGAAFVADPAHAPVRHLDSPLNPAGRHAIEPAPAAGSPFAHPRRGGGRMAAGDDAEAAPATPRAGAPIAPPAACVRAAMGGAPRQPRMIAPPRGPSERGPPMTMTLHSA